MRYFGLFVALVALAACGARSALDLPLGMGGQSAATTTSVSTTATTGSGERHCAFNCTIGHECCIGGCGGRAVPVSTDCCACQAGEVNSMMCPNDKCALPPICKVEGLSCVSSTECCSGVCDVSSANGFKNTCLAPK